MGLTYPLLTSIARMNDAATVFRPTREHVIAIMMMTGIALIGIAWSPLYLGWLLILPVLALAWVFKSSTTVSSDGIETTYLFRRNISVGWPELAGVNFKGSRAFATTVDGTEYAMPGVTFNSLPELERASNGRITDVITRSKEATDGKYEIIDKDGHSVLLTSEEYATYVKEHPDLPGPRPQAQSNAPQPQGEEQ